MGDYMKCGDGPWCACCRHNEGAVHGSHGYLTKNALGRCDFYAEYPAAREDEDQPRGGARQNADRDSQP